ncbi:MAG: KpsF/GutQ family sugar-phosphate isomerase [Deltaproteobacteria bacterium]|nr:KpsF/GutQ family sugar-phosphate isomerase [Deltaproteobacteria bacterium]
MTEQDEKKIIESAKKVLEIEAKAVLALKDNLDGDFSKAVEIILEASGKVVLMGMGKSGLICQKIASTLASTGTSAFFLHPAEGVHGDLGVLMKNDILLAVSNSGETEEIIRIIPAVKRMGIKMIAMTGKKNSTLSKHADLTLDISVEEEACPMGLAPTASTTATLAMGDALAVALLTVKGFQEEDFAILHPAGSLGKKLMGVAEMMHLGDGIPKVDVELSMKDVVLEMTAKRLGITAVYDGEKFVGAITDGDLRRSLEKGEDVFTLKAGDVMTKTPKTISEDALAESALRVMEEESITVLFVTSTGGEIKGVLHMHDLLKAGVL